jgi:hypothetical protein
MKNYGGVETFLSLALDGGEWLACHIQFTPRGKAVPELRLLVAGFPPQWPGFEPR